MRQSNRKLLCGLKSTGSSCVTFSYGCVCHALSNLTKDLCAHAAVSTTLAKRIKLAQLFRNKHVAMCMDEEDTDPDTDVCNVTAGDVDRLLAKELFVSSLSNSAIDVLCHTLSNDRGKCPFYMDVVGGVNDYLSATGVNTSTIPRNQVPSGGADTQMYSSSVARPAVAAVHGGIQPKALSPTIQQLAPPSIITALQAVGAYTPSLPSYPHPFANDLHVSNKTATGPPFSQPAKWA